MSRARRATDRLERLLALVPWVAAHPGGVAVDEVCERFQITRSELLADIDVVMMTGVHPYTPDTMIEAWMDEDLVTIRYADEFERPLRLTADEAVALITAARGLARIPGYEDDGPLARALARLDRVVGSDRATGIDVDLGRAGDDVFAALERSLAERTQVEITYPDIVDGTARRRRVEPASLFSSGGRWYVAGWCHHAREPRVFRVDRILSAQSTGDAFTGGDLPGRATIDFPSTLPQVTLRVDRSDAWLLDRVPVVDWQEEPNHVRVRLAIGSPAWLARFLVRLGSAAQVVEADPPLEPEADARAEARRILARYRR